MKHIVLLILFASWNLLAAESSTGGEKNRLLYESLLNYNVETWLNQSQPNQSKRIPSHLPTNWDSEEFSNPIHHKAEDFIYVVTAIREFFNFKDLKSKTLGVKKRAIFASLISSVDTDTFRESGLILKIFPEHIIGTSLIDTMFNWSQFRSYEDGAEFYRKNFGVLTPTEMYLGSHWDKYFTTYGLKQMFKIDTHMNNNELLLHGVDKEGRAVEIIGVFIKEGRLLNPDNKKGLLDFAEAQKLPVVMIPIIQPLVFQNAFE